MLKTDERAKIINEIEKYLKQEFNQRIINSKDEKEIKINQSKLWDNFYIKEQLEQRKRLDQNYKCRINDCIKAMVYSYLSSQNEWYIYDEYAL